jgi:hypothetical protein
MSESVRSCIFLVFRLGGTHHLNIAVDIHLRIYCALKLQLYCLLVNMLIKYHSICTAQIWEAY